MISFPTFSYCTSRLFKDHLKNWTECPKSDISSITELQGSYQASYACAEYFFHTVSNEHDFIRILYPKICNHLPKIKT